MKQFKLAVVFLILNNLLVLSQSNVNIDSLYQVYSKIDRYKDFLTNNYFSFKYQWEDGYIITLKNDTIYGQIKLHESGIHVTVKNEKITKRFRSDKYLSLKYGDRTFVSKTLDKYPVNAELIDTGKIFFYAFEETNKNGGAFGIGPVHTLFFYIEKDNAIYGPFNSNWKDFFHGFSGLTECINDYKALMDKLKNKEYKYSDLRIIIKIYNYWYNKNFR